MPESQEVRIIAETVSRHYAGQTLTSITIDEKSKFYKYPISDLNLLDHPKGWILDSVKSHGKKIIMTFKQGDVEMFLLSSLGMEGRWVLKEEKHSNLILNFGIKGKIDLVINRLYYDDSRHFGTIEIHTKLSLEKRMQKIGPDLYKDNVTFEAFRDKVRYSRIKTKPLFSFLMDQKYYSGLGAYLTAESLYRSKLSPHRELQSLSDKEIETLLRVIKEVLNIAAESHGLTIRTFHSPDGHQGTFPCHVYGKDTDPLGHQVIKSEFNKRRCWWVKEVQV